VAGIQFTTLVAGLATEIRGCPGFFTQMGFVAEYYFARILGGIGYILEIHGVGKGGCNDKCYRNKKCQAGYHGFLLL
jgi:hypothetical protein